MMLEMMSGSFASSCAFWAGLLFGAVWAVLLWLQLPGQTPRPTGLGRRAGIMYLALSGGAAWLSWSLVFGPVSAFFCLGGWGMILLCLAPILWAYLATRHNPAS